MDRIAMRELLACKNPYGFSAGLHHFVDLWARDSLFATFGANEAGMAGVTKKTLETFLRYQRRDGLIPYRVMRTTSDIGKYLGHPTYLPRPRPNFHSRQSGGIVPDGGLMTIIAASQYIGRTKDINFLRKQYGTLKLAAQWYEKQFRGNLIREWLLCEWADAVLKLGNTLYTNVLYWKALEDMSRLAHALGHQNDAQTFCKRRDHIGALVHGRFWNGRYFADWIDWKRQDYFASHPNMLAVLFGLTDAKGARAILTYAKIHCWNSFTLETNHPCYPFWRIPIVHHVIGMADYHNRGCLWLQPGILYAVALHQTGEKAEAKRVLTKISEKIMEYNGVYEVYEKSGAPVDRLLYKAEHPFAWSSGLFLWANDLVFGKKYG